MGEKECIERWLRDELVYGRICKDAAWFYLRQCILPIRMKRAVLDCDLQTMEKDQVISKERMLFCRELDCPGNGLLPGIATGSPGSQ